MSHCRARHWQSKWWLRSGRPLLQGPPGPGDEVGLCGRAFLAFTASSYSALLSQKACYPLPPVCGRYPSRSLGHKPSYITLAPCVVKVWSLLTILSFTRFHSSALSMPPTPVPEPLTPAHPCFLYADRRVTLSCHLNYHSTHTCPSSRLLHPSTAQVSPGHLCLYHVRLAAPLMPSPRPLILLFILPNHTAVSLQGSRPK